MQNILEKEEKKVYPKSRKRKGGVKMFTWVKSSTYSLVFTLYPNNITLNSSAASYFGDIRWAMLGIDKENLCLGVKPVTKREVDLQLVSMDQLHKVSIGKGYARISNKGIMKEISNLIKQPIDGQKVDVVYDEKENVLIADLHDLVQEER